MTFRTRIFVGVFGASAVAVGVTVALYAYWMRAALISDVETDLLHRARMASALVGTAPDTNLNQAAQDLAGLLEARVTFIDAAGTVLADSSVEDEQLTAIENHNQRAEVVGARASGSGVDIRRSRTTGIETLYAAVAVPGAPVSVIRVAMPLTAVERRLDLGQPVALIGLGTGLVAALALTWMTSSRLTRRIRAVAAAASRYRAGDFSRPAADSGRDEIGQVALALDQTARDLGQRLGDMARDRAHMEAILTGMAEGIVLVNASGRLVLTNPAVRAMLQLPDPAAGRHYTEVVRQPDITAQLSAALSGRVPTSVEVQLQPGGRRTYSASVVPVPTEPGGGAVLVLHDVTDIRRAHEVRRDFVANVSHELRTPLTAIRGYVEALHETTVPEEARGFLDIIERQALRMERLVQDLLHLARLDAGQETLERVDCDIAGIAQAIERDMRAILDARAQQIHVSIGADASTVRADAARLHDVLHNLITNASTYGPAGSVIDVSTCRTDTGIDIVVADRGPGIPATDLERVFERFYRVDRSRSRDPGGTGLGLSIVRHLVELHGGRVVAAPREGGGAELRVSLPDVAG